MARLDDSNEAVRLAALESLRECLPLVEVGAQAAAAAAAADMAMAMAMDSDMDRDMEVIEVAEGRTVIDLDAAGADPGGERRPPWPEFGHLVRSCLVQLRVGEAADPDSASASCSSSSSSNPDSFTALAVDVLREAAPRDTAVFLAEARRQNRLLRTNEFESLIDHAELIDSLKKR